MPAFAQVQREQVDVEWAEWVHKTELQSDGRNHGGYQVRSPAENRRLFMELVSGSTGPGRHEFYVTGEDYIPDSLVIAQMFPEAVDISNTKLREYSEGGHLYAECRIGFRWSREPQSCAHIWDREVLVDNTCLSCGRERIWCRRCGLEEDAYLPAVGHLDRDQDSLCDRCGVRFLEQKAGDIIRVLYEDPGSSAWMNFICMEELEKGVLYVSEETWINDIILKPGEAPEAATEERVMQWLRMGFENHISVRSACLGLFLADNTGKVLEEGAWKPEYGIRPALLLEPPSVGDRAEKMAWYPGDVQIRSLGGKNYLFRCVDEDYGDSISNYQKTALFLCDTVIRSDIDSTDSQKTTLEFGKNNNYKSSGIRRWLAKNSEECQFDLMDVYTGVNSAFTGKSEDMAFSQTGGDRLKKWELPFQLLKDRMFLLSVEEALKYREVLWKFSGSELDNPESQLSPYSRGYWLRTPVYGGEMDTVYGDQIYVVDLEEGCLRPADVRDTAIGIRPAFCVPQA